METTAKINVYKGEWELPSIDFECLRALCLVKFCGFPININHKINPFLSKNGILPYINYGNKKIIGYQKIKNFLEEKGYTANSDLTSDIKSLASAYEILVFNNLHPYYQYFLFGHPQNIDNTRTLYAKRIPFPFNFYYPNKFMKIAEDVIEIFAGFSIHEKIEFHETDQITLNAKKCVNMLVTKLGNKKWFFGNESSEFDSLVYSYLSIILNITLPNNPLQAHLKECPNLLKFINRITKDYFRNEGFSSKIVTNSTTDNKESANLTPTEKDFFASKRKTQFLAAFGAILAMSTYAAWIGIVKISTDGQYDDVFNYDDDEEIEDDH